MKVSEIQELLSGMPDNAVLSHVWTAPIGDVVDGIQKLKTKLYFKSGKVRMEASLDHVKDTTRAQTKTDPKKLKTSPTLGDKFGNLFS